MTHSRSGEALHLVSPRFLMDVSAVISSWQQVSLLLVLQA